MTRKRKKGFSLVEVMIGVAIFATVGVAFLSFLSQSIGESKFSAEYFSAFILSQKVMEDFSEEIAINPYGFETLGVDENSTQYSEVVDGATVHFSGLEDQQKPYGKIDPGADNTINAKVVPLYEIVKKFQFRAQAKRLEKTGDGEKRNLLRCNLEFLWDAKIGKGQYETSCSFFSPVTAKKIDLALNVDQAAIDARIPKDFFNAPGKSLAQIANERSSTVETVTALGRIALVTEDFMKSQYYTKQMKAIADLKKKLALIPASQFDQEYAVRLAIALAWYDLAKACYQIVVYLEPCFATLQSQNVSALQTGTNTLNPIQLQEALFHYRIIYEYFVGSIVQARFYYYALIEKDLALYKGGKRELQVLQKLIDLYRIVALLASVPTGMDQYKAFLGRLDTFADGRNLYLQRMVRQEMIYLQDPAVWMEKFPNLKRISSIVKDRIPQILAFIKARTDDAVLNADNSY